MMKDRHYLKASGLCLFLISMLLILHTIPIANSMINYHDTKYNPDRMSISNDYLSYAIEYHRQLPAFAKRPVTTKLIELVEETGLNPGQSFTLINFLLLFICGLLVYYLSVTYKNTRKESMFSVITFFLSFTILFIFFPPVYSYDEPIQYVFLFVSILMLKKQKWPLFILGFSISLIARETSVILLPAIILYLLPEKIENISEYLNRQYLGRLLIAGSPIIIYLLFMIWFMQRNDLYNKTYQDVSTSLHLFTYNFQNCTYSIDTLSSMFLALGIQSFLIYNYWSKNMLSDFEKRLFYSFIISVFINSTIVLLNTKARESRVFALPLIFIWPFLGKYLSFFIDEIKEILSNIKINFHEKIIIIFGSCFFIFIDFLICLYVYPINGWKLFKLNLFIQLGIIWFIIVIKSIGKLNRSTI